MVTLFTMPNFKGTKDEKIFTLTVCILLDAFILGCILYPS